MRIAEYKEFESGGINVSKEKQKIYEYVVKIYLRDKTSRKYALEFEKTFNKDDILKFIVDHLLYKQFLIIDGEAININSIEYIKVMDNEDGYVPEPFNFNICEVFNIREDTVGRELRKSIETYKNTIGLKEPPDFWNPDI